MSGMSHPARPPQAPPRVDDESTPLAEHEAIFRCTACGTPRVYGNEVEVSPEHRRALLVCEGDQCNPGHRGTWRHKLEKVHLRRHVWHEFVRVRSRSERVN